ncbi:MAG: phosphatase PAP2 family protein [Chloroflexi bacterium]|nr:phosphatase PAP2 family protein [Chloroflexota bacterium]MCC6892571.1 phosphatase PAP2 family protein [Anaerolineae bacterium]
MNWLRNFEKSIPERLRPYVTAYVVVGLLICIVSILIFGNLVDGVSENESIVAFDIALANELHRGATTTSTSIYLLISLFGGTILFVWSVVVGLIFAWKRQRLGLIIWVVTISGGQILNAALKLFFARPRPTFASPLVIEQYYSFPSGHAMMSFIAYGMLAYVICVLLKNNAQRLVVTLLAALIIILIGISRMALGVHYFSDVIAGYSVAALWLVICVTVWRSIQQRRSHHSPTA